MEISKKLSYKAVVILGFLVYFFSYTMRLDYSATIVAIVSDLDITKTAASFAVTGSFITYGLGQIVFGFVGDKFSPIKIITIAMLGTVAVNVLVSLCSSILLITVLWCINGFCQAMIWPPLTRFVSEQMGVEKFSAAISIINIAASIGTIFVYLMVPAILSLTVWRNVFRCMAFFGIIIVVIWYFVTKNVFMGKANVNIESEKTLNISLGYLIKLADLVPVFIVIALHGTLRDGIQTWLPSLVKEQFALSEESSVLSTTIIPIISMISIIVANLVYRKMKDELKTSAIMFFVAFVATVPLLFGTYVPAVLTVFLAALISGCMHGINLMLISFIPKRFAKYGMVSTCSGILNAFTYLGSSLSTYGFAAIADNFGWKLVIISWCAFALLSTLICVFKIKGWNAFVTKKA